MPTCKSVFHLLLTLWILMPRTGAAQSSFDGTVVRGDYLNLSFTGDGKTPSASALYDAQERQLAAPKAAAKASDQGDAGYSIPLPLPPAQLSPDVSIQYSSAAGDHTFLSRGWTLSAGMSITRITGQQASQAYAAEAEAAANQGADLYRVAGGGLDGLLIPTSDGWQYVSTGGVAVVANSDGQQWTIRTGGVETILDPVYGTLGTEGGAPVGWHAIRSRDESGNTVEYQWLGNELGDIFYGGATTPDGSVRAGEEPLVDLHFVYTARQSASYLAQSGVMDVIDDQLVRLEVRSRYGSSALVSRLDLDFHYADPTSPTGAPVAGERTLHEVLRRDPDSGEESLVAQFAYAPYDPSAKPTDGPPPALFSSGETLVRGPRQPSPTATTGGLYDSSGDGVGDTWESLYGYWSVHEQTWDGSTTSWEQAGTGPLLPQYGFPDAKFTYLSPSSAFPVALTENSNRGLDRSYTVRCSDKRDATYPNQSTTYTVRALVDLNSDGFTDAVQTNATVPAPLLPNYDSRASFCWQRYLDGSTKTVWTVYYGGPDGFVDGIQVVPPVDFPRIGAGIVTRDLPQPLPYAQEARGGYVDLLDVDGDGWADVVRVLPTGGNNTRLVVHYHEGQDGGGWGPAVYVDGDNPLLQANPKALDDADQILAEDSNAVSGAHWMELTPRVAETDAHWAFQDLNGDGIADFVDTASDADGDGISDNLADRSKWFTNNVWHVYLGTGERGPNAFLPPMDWPAPIRFLSRTEEGTPKAISCRMDTNPPQPGAAGQDPNHGITPTGVLSNDLLSPSGGGGAAIGDFPSLSPALHDGVRQRHRPGRPARRRDGSGSNRRFRRPGLLRRPPRWCAAGAPHPRADDLRRGHRSRLHLLVEDVALWCAGRRPTDVDPPRPAHAGHRHRSGDAPAGSLALLLRGWRVLGGQV